MNSRKIWAAGLFLAAAIGSAQSYTISTIAGGAPPPTPVPALNASLGQPTSVAADSAGNVYFTSLNCIFKIDTKGVATRIAGTSRPDYSGDGGLAINAALNNPVGLVTDPAGNLYVSDSGNHRIRELTTDGKIQTIAGTGNIGDAGDDGSPLASTFTHVTAIARDTAGNLYFADAGAHAVRKLTSTGIMRLIAGTYAQGYSGDGAIGYLAQLFNPTGVAVDAAGNVYIADTGNQVIRKVTTDGNIATFAGTAKTAGYTGDGGAAASAQLNVPQSMVIDKAGNLYIADYANAVIRLINSSGTISTFAGTSATPGFSGDGGAASAAKLNGIRSLGIDPTGNIYVADYSNLRIRKIAAGTNIITSIGGGGFTAFSGDGGPATQALLGNPYGVAVDTSGNVYFSDFQNFRVRKIAPNGVITTIAGNGTPGYSGDGGQATKAQLFPTGLALDSSGNLYIADYVNSLVRKVSTSGVITTVAGSHTLGSGYTGDGGQANLAQLSNPSAVVVDGFGNLFIADSGNFVIRKVVPSGFISTVVGTNVKGYCCDNAAGTTAQLDYVNGLAVDAQGNLYISDWGNFRVRKLSSSQVITTIAGNGMQGFSGDGLAATSTEISNPYGVVADAAGNVYFGDSFNSRIRKIDTGGIVTTIAGDGNVGFSGDGGPATIGEFSYALGLALDTKGNFYFADTLNDAIRMLTPAAAGGNSIGVTNAASNQLGAIAPGEIVTLYGSNLGPEQLTAAVAAGGAFPTQVANTQVLFNGIAAPVIYASAKQTAVIVPYDVAGAGRVSTEVHYNGSVVTLPTLPVATTQPGVFSANASGLGQAAALNQDTSPNSAQNPARRGSVIVLYATGEGQTSPGGVNGRQNQLNGPVSALPHPMLPVSVTIGGVPATVQYAGAVPGQVAGLLQINVVVPPTASTGNAIPVVVTVGGASSQAGITVAVATN